MTSSSSVSCCSNYYYPVDNCVSCCTAMTDSCNSSYNSIKISEFPFSAKNKNPTKEIIYFSKDFFLFANYSFNQVPLSYILGPILRGPSHKNTRHPWHYYPSLPHSIILKYHSFC